MIFQPPLPHARGIALYRHWVGWGAVVLVWFIVIYGGCNWLTAQRTTRVRLDFEFERSIPVVPAMAYVYLSLTPLMWCSGWVLTDPREWRALAFTMMAAITLGGIGFLILPADLAYPPLHESLPVQWHGLFAFVRWLVGDHNLFPSLHVALAWICMSAYCREGPVRLQPVWIVWSGVIIAATVLAHQHHLVDVVGGMVVGWLCFKLVYRRW